MWTLPPSALSLSLSSLFEIFIRRIVGSFEYQTRKRLNFLIFCSKIVTNNKFIILFAIIFYPVMPYRRRCEKKSDELLQYTVFGHSLRSAKPAQGVNVFPIIILILIQQTFLPKSEFLINFWRFIQQSKIREGLILFNYYLKSNNRFL